MFRRFYAGLMVLTLAFPLHAAPSDDVLDALELDQLLEIMREEGVLYGSEMATDLFAGGENARWLGLLDDIYDVDKMDQLVRRNFSDVLGDTDTTKILDFFESDLGKRAVSLELSARRAMIDDSVEDAARESYHTADDAVLGRVTDFIEANDLIEANVTGALNASFQFYRGMVDGGGFKMSESEILSDVWAQEAETRKDTEEWIYGFLMMAYGPLADADLEKYTRFSASPQGRALNLALFAGFNAMYDEISYALGLAAAEQMQGLDL